MKPLTERQMDVLYAIKQFIEEKRYAPTVREVMKLVGHQSQSTTHGLMTKLKLQGYISWDASKPRTLFIIKDTTSTF
ncbi:LexA family protein [Paenibacillus gansuensis]|uniref:LexA repressor DNA-binding domain-containing protein n=1 Tax=Paenibacillus gansuensis TaxID=306542 RepID=A0ABW5PF01_9BACL